MTILVTLVFVRTISSFGFSASFQGVIHGTIAAKQRQGNLLFLADKESQFDNPNSLSLWATKDSLQLSGQNTEDQFGIMQFCPKELNLLFTVNDDTSLIVPLNLDTQALTNFYQAYDTSTITSMDEFEIPVSQVCYDFDKTEVGNLKLSSIKALKQNGMSFGRDGECEFELNGELELAEGICDVFDDNINTQLSQVKSGGISSIEQVITISLDQDQESLEWHLTVTVHKTEERII